MSTPPEISSNQRRDDAGVVCPVIGPVPFVPCPLEQIEPIIQFLSSGASVLKPTAFERGTIMPDGRLDLCKQSIGPHGCKEVVQSLIASKIESIRWLIDQPVSNSGRLRQKIDAILTSIMCEGDTGDDIQWQIELVHDPDAILKKTSEIVITSDSVILDRCSRWYNAISDIWLTRLKLDPHDESSTWMVDFTAEGNPTDQPGCTVLDPS